MHTNELGDIVAEEWLRSAEIRAEIDLDAFVVMPNHLHGIVLIDSQNANLLDSVDEAPYSRSLSACIGGFKQSTTRRINQVCNTAGQRTWQRGFYDHIIRTDRALEAIRDYIEANPSNWVHDPENR